MSDYPPHDAETVTLTLLQADLDDESPEALAEFAAGRLRSGALDVVLIPVLMKKGRAGTRIEILVTPEEEDGHVAAILRETKTLGVRRISVLRTALDRREESIEIDGRQISVKVALWEKRPLKAKPEWDDIVAAAENLGRPIREIQAEAEAAARDLLREKKTP